jgi:hypothetical protein
MIAIIYSISPPAEKLDILGQAVGLIKIYLQILTTILHLSPGGSAIIISINRTVLAYVIRSLIVGALIFGATRILNRTHTSTIISDVVQGLIIGGVLAFFMAQILRYSVGDRSGLVESDSDLSTAYNLAKQIQLAQLSQE